MQIDRLDLAPRVATLRMYPIVVVHPILEVATPFINAGDDMNASRSAGLLYCGIS